MSFLQGRLALLKSALEYLDCHKQLEIIKQSALDYRNLQVDFIYNFNIDIDLGHVFEQDVMLATNILSMPLESATLFQEIIFQFCLSYKLLPSGTTSTQICARLRITNFPSDSQSLQISKLSDLTKHLNYLGFVRLVGVATGVSGVAKYTQSTKYVCPDEGCGGHKGNHYIRIHVPGASETQTIRNDFMCTLCGETLEEVKSLRILSDKIALDVMPFQLQVLGWREAIRLEFGQAIPVIVRDELVNAVEPGKSYEVIGICRTEFLGDDITVTLEANNITQLMRPLLPHLSVLPQAFQDIYATLDKDFEIDCQESPWSFPLNVACKFGDKIAPNGTMIKFRLLILMSLVLCPQKYSLHILGIGRETRLLQSLMEYAQQFSLRSFRASSAIPLTGKVIYDKHTWAPYFMQCGSLLLSCGGVCLVDDVGGWKKARKEQLQAVLTDNKIILDLPSKLSGGLSQQLTFSLECQVWGVYGPRTVKPRAASGHRDNVFHGCDTGDLTKGFLDAFSYTCFLDSGDSATENEIMTQVTGLILSSCWELERNDDSTKGFSNEEFEHFLAVSRQVEVQMLPDAESLIQNYYTASRAARSSGLNGSDVPSSAIFTLTSLSVGFAKLKLQPFVTECDALMAVFLYEESMAARYGVSVLNIQPQPHVPNSKIDDFLGKQTDLAMQKFHVQLLRFCSCAIEGCSFYKEE